MSTLQVVGGDGAVIFVLLAALVGLPASAAWWRAPEGR